MMTSVKEFIKLGEGRRDIQYRIRLNQEENDRLGYLSDQLQISKADTIRFALACLEKMCEEVKE